MGGGVGGGEVGREDCLDITCNLSILLKDYNIHIVIAVRDACERADSVNNTKKNRAILTSPAVKAIPPDDRRPAAGLGFPMNEAFWAIFSMIPCTSKSVTIPATIRAVGVPFFYSEDKKQNKNGKIVYLEQIPFVKTYVRIKRSWRAEF